MELPEFVLNISKIGAREFCLVIVCWRKGI